MEKEEERRASAAEMINVVEATPVPISREFLRSSAWVVRITFISYHDL
jgi:hypothetical protein